MIPETPARSRSMRGRTAREQHACTQFVTQCGERLWLVQPSAELAISLAVARPVHAAPLFTVDSTVGAHRNGTPGARTAVAPGSPCTLRAAIEVADTIPGSTVDVPNGVFTLALGSLTVTAGMTIQGAGVANTIVDGADQITVFQVTGVKVKIARLRIREGNAKPGVGLPGLLSEGGGVENEGNLLLSEDVLIELRRWCLQNLDCCWRRWANSILRLGQEAARASLFHCVVSGVLGAPQGCTAQSSATSSPRRRPASTLWRPCGGRWRPMIKEVLGYWRAELPAGSFRRPAPAARGRSARPEGHGVRGRPVVALTRIREAGAT